MQASKTCVNGHSVPADALFCGVCGASLLPDYADPAGDATPLLLSPPVPSPWAVGNQDAPATATQGGPAQPTAWQAQPPPQPTAWLPQPPPQPESFFETASLYSPGGQATAPTAADSAAAGYPAGGA